MVGVVSGRASSQIKYARHKKEFHTGSVGAWIITTTTTAGEKRGTDRNLAIISQKEEEDVTRQREKRKVKRVELRVSTLNVGTMTGKGRELTDMMQSRKVEREARLEALEQGSSCTIIV